MNKALDHFVISVKDSTVAASAYERLGFHVRPLAEHEDIGSRNCVIHFDETYLELIDVSGSPPWMSDFYTQRFSLGEGLSHVSLTSDDLEADQQRLTSQGFKPERVMSARRAIIRPDGAADETASSCFYNRRPDNPYLSLFFSAHAKPDAIFIPEYVCHANGAREVSRCVFVSTTLNEDKAYFAKSFDAPPSSKEEGRLAWCGARGDLTELLSPELARARYGDLLELGTPGEFAGMGIAMHYRVADLGATRKFLQQNSIAVEELDENQLAVDATDGVGCIVVFEEKTR